MSAGTSFSTQPLSQKEVEKLIAEIVFDEAMRHSANDPNAWTVARVAAVELEWEQWLRTFFAGYFRTRTGEDLPFSPAHRRLWEWVWRVELGVAPPPAVVILARGGGKSTGAELAAVALAARQRRRYGLYICRVQEQADDHLSTLGAHFESEEFGKAYPDVADRAIGKFGNPKGWRRNRLRTRSGFTMDALGLDKASARGMKIEEDRPDFMIFDDIDSELDTDTAVERLITIISRRVLPAGAGDLAVLWVQNLVHHRSVAARLARVAGEPIDILHNRAVIGPYPALENFAYEQTSAGRVEILEGVPTWEGQGRAECQHFIDTYGITAFRAECQHEDITPGGGIFAGVNWRRCTRTEVPSLVAISCWVDPAVTAHDRSDSCGIQIDGLGEDGIIYRLFSWERKGTPRQVLRVALEQSVYYGATVLGVETDQGGELWREAFAEVVEDLWAEHGEEWTSVAPPTFEEAKAGAGHGPKAHRASLMLSDYERGMFVHVEGTHELLENALRRFGLRKPFDLVDASYWSWQDLKYGTPVGVKFY